MNPKQEVIELKQAVTIDPKQALTVKAKELFKLLTKPASMQKILDAGLNFCQWLLTVSENLTLDHHGTLLSNTVIPNLHAIKYSLTERQTFLEDNRIYNLLVEADANYQVSFLLKFYLRWQTELAADTFSEQEKQKFDLLDTLVDKLLEQLQAKYHAQKMGYSPLFKVPKAVQSVVTMSSPRLVL